MPANDEQRAELQKALLELKKIQDENARLTQEVEEQKGEIAQLKAEDEGWLVTTPNPAYDGVTLGVQFNSGQAFIPKKAYYAQMDMGVVKDTTLEKKGLSDREKAEYRKRETALTSELLVNRLHNDFGYKLEFFGSDRVGEIKERVSKRSIERAEFDKLQTTKGLKMMKAMVSPQTIGG